MKRIFRISAATMIAFSLAWGAEKGRIRGELKVPFIRQVVPGDIDGDGLTDLIMVQSVPRPSGPPQRRITVHFQKKGFDTLPDLMLDVPAACIAFDWSDIDHDRRAEFLLLSADSLTVWDPDIGGIILFIRTKSLFSGPDPESLIRWPMFFNIDRSPDPELIVPVSEGFRIFKTDSTGLFVPCSTLQTGFGRSARVDQTLSLTLRLPGMMVRDMNGDTIPDLVLLDGETMTVFPNENGNPATVKIGKKTRFAVRDTHLSLLESLAPADIRLTVTDLDQDGFGDVVLSKASQAGFTKTNSQLQIYMNRNGRFSGLPDQVLTADNFFGDHVIADLNGDGLTDLALLQFPIGLVKAARFLLTKRTKTGYDIYYQTPGHTFHNFPDEQARFTRHAKIRNIFRPELISFTDWNGDGRIDFLASTSRSKAAVFFQDTPGVFSDKAGLEFEIPITPENWSGDLNQDGLGDLLFWNPESGRVIYLLSQPRL